MSLTGCPDCEEGVLEPDEPVVTVIYDGFEYEVEDAIQEKCNCCGSQFASLEEAERQRELLIPAMRKRKVRVSDHWLTSMIHTTSPRKKLYWAVNELKERRELQEAFYCPECGCGKLDTTWTKETVPVRADRWILVEVPVRKCVKCSFEFTDQECEELIDRAVKKIPSDDKKVLVR